MRKRQFGATRLAVATIASLLAVSACGGIEISTGGEMSAGEVASKAEEALAPKVDAEPIITCEESLQAEEGDTTTCTMRVGDDPKEYDVEATVSAVDGDNASLDFRSDEYRPSNGEGTIFADEVARKAEDALEKQFGMRPQITCPEDLPGEEGAKTRCVLTAEGDDTQYGMTAEVTEMDGAKYHLDFKVDEQPIDDAA